jgi:6-phosphogluconolactonase (cycloisomerase 2 family)
LQWLRLDASKVRPLQKGLYFVRVSDARYAICPTIAIFLLTNCGGSATPVTAIGSQPNMSQRIIHHRTSSCPCLYAVNQEGNSVTVYASGATGNATPIQDISGSKTGLSAPFGVAVDGSGNIYVSNTGEDTITVYAAGATGNVSPLRTIVGGANDFPKGIAIDPLNGDIYVTKPSDNAIYIFAPNANGEASPIGSIEGSETLLNNPSGVALGSNADVYVTNKEKGESTTLDSTQRVTVYAAGSTGNVAPMQTIAGERTGLDVPFQVALDSSSHIYVANFAGSLTVYGPKANGDVEPKETIAGAKTELNLPVGIALDNANNIYASNYHGTNFADSSITVYAASATGNVAPINTISGANTGLEGPREIVIH